jgi:hypothetical protein
MIFNGEPDETDWRGNVLLKTQLAQNKQCRTRNPALFSPSTNPVGGHFFCKRVKKPKGKEVEMSNYIVGKQEEKRHVKAQGIGTNAAGVGDV